MIGGMRRMIWIAALVVGACSKEAASGTSPAAAPTTAPKPAGKDVPTNLNICELMPPATVSKITGTTFDKAERDDTPSYHLFACNYTSGPPTPRQMRISMIGKNGKIGFDGTAETLTKTKHALQPVSGIGDAAYTSDGPWCRLAVLYGDVKLDITGWDELTVDQAKQIISGLHDKM